MISSGNLSNRLDEINNLDYSEFDFNEHKKEPVFPVDLNKRTIKVPSDFETLCCSWGS